MSTRLEVSAVINDKPTGDDITAACDALRALLESNGGTRVVTVSKGGTRTAPGAKYQIEVLVKSQVKEPVAAKTATEVPKKPAKSVAKKPAKVKK